MGSSIIYLFCLCIILTDKDNRTKACAFLCSMHIVLENCLNYYLDNNILLFELGLYLTLLWSMDLMLVLICMMILSGLKKKMLSFICGFIVVLQIIFVQYPQINDYVSYILITQGYYTFIETFILLSSFKTETIKDIIKTTILSFSLIAVHIIY